MSVGYEYCIAHDVKYLKGTPCPVCTGQGKMKIGEAPDHAFSSGAKRSSVMPYFAAIPHTSIRRVALRATGAPRGETLREGGFDYEGGSRKYGYGNWARGLPMEDTFNHVTEHLGRWRTAIQEGRVPSDDDLAAAAWGILLPLMTFEQEYARQYGLRNVMAKRNGGASAEDLDRQVCEDPGTGKYGYLLQPLATQPVKEPTRKMVMFDDPMIQRRCDAVFSDTDNLIGEGKNTCYACVLAAGHAGSHFINRRIPFPEDAPVAPPVQPEVKSAGMLPIVDPSSVSAPTAYYCGEQNYQGMVCTRFNGHAGYHMAQEIGGKELGRWPPKWTPPPITIPGVFNPESRPPDPGVIGAGHLCDCLVADRGQDAPYRTRTAVGLALTECEFCGGTGIRK